MHKLNFCVSSKFCTKHNHAKRTNYSTHTSKLMYTKYLFVNGDQISNKITPCVWIVTTDLYDSSFNYSSWWQFYGRSFWIAYEISVNWVLKSNTKAWSWQSEGHLETSLHCSCTASYTTLWMLFSPHNNSVC